MKINVRCVGVVLVGLLMCASTARAQATRTWVSGVGDDANPCSRTAPCKTFAGAISKTVANGEISVLDPGGFGTITITKAITINGGGIEGSILAALTNGVIVNAPAGSTVILRNLSINGAGTGLNGIRVLGSSTVVYVDNCQIERFTGFAIDYQTTSTSFLLVKNSQIRNNIAGGIQMKALTGAGARRASIANTHFEGNSFAVKVDNTSVINTSVATLDQVIAAGSGVAGLWVTGAGAQMAVRESTVTANNEGLRSDAGGTIRFMNSMSSLNIGLDGNSGGGGIINNLGSHIGPP